MSKKTFIEEVVSDKMKNTVIVAIERNIAHPRYGKLIKRTQKLMADKSGMDVIVGDIVKIEEIRPMSKNKNFKVVKKENGSKST
jgi:small subunit ribosomal protein S17